MIYSFLVCTVINGFQQTIERRFMVDNIGIALDRVRRLQGYKSHQFIGRSQIN